MTDIDIEVTHAPERLRYEARVDGTVVGFAEYILATDLIVLTHTEVDPAYEGKGVGSAIAQASSFSSSAVSRAVSLISRR